MQKIAMKTPLVEMDGDEMTRVLWQWIKELLIEPYVDLKTEYYDLGLVNRDKTDDQVTVDAANATAKYGVAVKCATITPNAAARGGILPQADVEEPQRHHPRHAGRHGVPRARSWSAALSRPCAPGKAPITIARHAYGDVYKNAEMTIPGPGKAELVYTADDGTETRALIHRFQGRRASFRGMHNLDESIESFARSCFDYALDVRRGSVVLHEGHHLQDLRPPTSRTSLTRSFDAEYEGKFDGGGHRILLHAHRRCGGARHPQPRAASSGRARTTTAT